MEDVEDVTGFEGGSYAEADWLGSIGEEDAYLKAEVPGYEFEAGFEAVSGFYGANFGGGADGDFDDDVSGSGSLFFGKNGGDELVFAIEVEGSFYADEDVVSGA